MQARDTSHPTSHCDHVRSQNQARRRAQESPRLGQGPRHRRQLRGRPRRRFQTPSHGFEPRLVGLAQASRRWLRALPMRSRVDDGDEPGKYGASIGVVERASWRARARREAIPRAIGSFAVRGRRDQGRRG